MLSLRWADLNDHLDDSLTEHHIWIVFKAVTEELEKNTRFLRDPLIKLAHRLDGLNFEINAKIWEIGTDLLQQFLHLILVASL